MSVTFDAVGPGATGIQGIVVASLTWTHTPAGIPTAIGVTVSHTQATPSAVTSGTYGGTPLAISANKTAGLGEFSAILGLANPAAGARTVIVNFSGNFIGAAGSISVVGSSIVTVFSNVSAGATANGVTMTDSPCTSAIGELVIDAAGSGVSGAITPGAGQTQRWNALGGFFSAASSSKPGAASITMTETASSGIWVIISASFKAAAAAAIGKSRGHIFG